MTNIRNLNKDIQAAREIFSKEFNSQIELNSELKKYAPAFYLIAKADEGEKPKWFFWSRCPSYRNRLKATIYIWRQNYWNQTERTTMTVLTKSQIVTGILYECPKCDYDYCKVNMSMKDLTELWSQLKSKNLGV